MIGFRSLCDINEDFFPEDRLFCGGPGLLDIHGLKKASYYTFVQINHLGETLLAKGPNYIFTKNGTQYQLLLFHTAFPAYDDPLLSYEQRYQCYGNVPPISLCAVLDLPSGNYLIRQTEVSRTSGSAYNLWVKMGSPQYDTSEILNYIRTKAIPDCYYKEATITDQLLINVELEAHSVVLIEIMENKK